MNLYLIRHGQSTNNVLEDVLDRHFDPDLTERGYRQAELLGEAFATGLYDFQLTALYCSPMRRAMLTARQIATALDLTPRVWTDVFEFGGMYLEDADGNTTGYPGMTRAEMAADFPEFDLPEEVTENGWWDVTLGKETKAACADRTRRVARALETRMRADEHARIAIVSHAGFIDRLIRVLLGHDFPEGNDRYIYRYFSDNTGITHIRLHNDPEWPTAMHYMNRVDHLPIEMRWNGEH